MNFDKPYENGLVGDEIVNLCNRNKFEDARQIIIENPNVNVNDLRHSLLGSRLLHFCVQGDATGLDFMKFLVEEKGVDLNSQDNFGQTPFYIAADQGCFDFCKYLAEKGANINFRDSMFGYGLLHICCKNPMGLDFMKFLVEKKTVDLNSQDNLGQTPIYIAVQKRGFDFCKYLTDNGANLNAKHLNGSTAIFVAAEGNCPDILQLLIDAGAFINETDNKGWTALTHAAYKGLDHPCQILLDNGAQCNLADKQGWTPLFYAAKYNRLSTCRLLLANSANVNFRAGETNRETALFGPAYCGHLSICELLVDNAIDVNAEDSNGRNALYFAIRDGHMNTAQYLCWKGATLPPLNEVEFYHGVNEGCRLSMLEYCRKHQTRRILITLTSVHFVNGKGSLLRLLTVDLIRLLLPMLEEVDK